MKTFKLKDIKFELKSYDLRFKKYIYIPTKKIYLIIKDEYRGFLLAEVKKILFLKSIHNNKILSCPSIICMNNNIINKIDTINLNTIKKEKRYFEFIINKEEAEEKIKTLNLFQ